jgi:hypothetical protein
MPGEAPRQHYRARAGDLGLEKLFEQLAACSDDGMARGDFMPEPISSNANSSVYDRAQLMSDASCDPSTTTCGPPPPSPPVNVVTIEPVLIEGDAGPSELVAAYDKANRPAPQCKSEAAAAAIGCGTAAFSAAATVGTSITGVGLVAGAGVTAANLVNCWYLIDNYTECREVGAARAAAADRCEERGGVPLSGALDNELVCLMGVR